MRMKLTFEAQKRGKLSRGQLQKLRKEGRLPSVVFGKDTPSTMIHVSTKEFEQWQRNGGPRIVDLKIDGNQVLPVLLEGIQRDPVSRELIHADFLHVRMDEAVKTKLPIEFIGTAAGTKTGGILQTQSASIDVEGLPGQLPASITVDISHLEVGESLFVEQLVIPEGVTVLSAPNELLVSVVAPRLNQEEEEEAAGE